MRTKVCVFFMYVLLLACDSSRQYELSGKLLYSGKPVNDGEVQVYLKEEKDKLTPPIKVIPTDARGEFTVMLPKGKYFLTAKKKHEDTGEVHMLVGTYPGNPVVINAHTRLNDWTLYSKKDRSNYKGGIGIRGRISGFRDYRNVRVYAYCDTSSALKGPEYAASGKIDAKGSFLLDLTKGTFYVSVRERKKGNVGPLREGDMTGVFAQNPLNIAENGYRELGVIRLKPVDKEKNVNVSEKGVYNTAVAVIKGGIHDRDKKPVKNIYVIAYDNQEMVGRPAFISMPSNASGEFVMQLSKAGKYFIGARSKLGGPAEPGEKIGSYSGSLDKSVSIEPGEVKIISIEVTEVW